MSSVSDREMEAYLATFTATYRDTARAFLPADALNRLQRYAYVARPVVGHISTQFGAGFEYVDDADRLITIRHGSDRIENVFLSPPAWVRKLPPLISLGVGTGVAQMTLGGTFRLRGEDSAAQFIRMRFGLVGDGPRSRRRAPFGLSH